LSPNGRIYANQNTYRTHCKRGHPLSGDNLRLKPKGDTRISRACRICTRLQAKKDSKSIISSKRARGEYYWNIILATYGPVCKCCGETERGFLTLDHINGHGEGYHHRKEKGCYGVGMYRDIIKQGCPKDRYRILCIQCNWATRYGKPCPHTLKVYDVIALAGAC
jgi:hypothetical protein